MSDVEDEDSKTADSTTEAPEKSTEEKVPKTQADEPADSSTAADDDGDNDSEEDGEGESENGEAEDSEAQKQKNREGFQIRQLIDNNPNVQSIRDKLQSWVDDSADDREQKDRQRDVNDYVKDVVRAQDDIQRDNELVTREIPLFNKGSKDFNEQLTQRALSQYARDMVMYDQNGITDKNGNPIVVGYRMRLLDYMHEKAEDYGYASRGKSVNQEKPKAPRKAKAEMDARADTPSGSSAEQSKPKGRAALDEAFLAGFDDPYGRHKPDKTFA